MTSSVLRFLSVLISWRSISSWISRILILLLVFLLADPAVVAIPRSGDSTHTLENAAAAGVTLSPEEWALMNQAFPAPRHREPLDIL